MKKSVILLIVFVLTSIIIISNIKADTLTDINNQVNNIQNTADKLSNDNKRNQFFQEQWANFLANTSIGKSIKDFGDYIAKANPIFKFVLGAEFSWTWTFFLTLIIWICLTIWIHRVETIRNIFTSSKLLRFLIAASISIVLAIIGLTGIFVTLLMKLINYPDSIIFRVMISVLILFGLFYVSLSTKLLQSIFRSIERKEDERKLRKDVEELKEKVEEEG